MSNLLPLFFTLSFITACSTIPPNTNEQPIDSPFTAPLNIEERPDLKTFMVLKYQYISNDIVYGDGVHIRTLMQWLNISEENFNRELISLRKILKQSQSIYDFTNNVLARYKTWPDITSYGTSG